MFTKEELLAIRKQTGLTQKAFAEKIGVSTVLIAMAETGQKPVSRHLLQKIADGLDKEIKITILPR